MFVCTKLSRVDRVASYYDIGEVLFVYESTLTRRLYSVIFNYIHGTMSIQMINKSKYIKERYSATDIYTPKRRIKSRIRFLSPEKNLRTQILSR